MSSTRADLPNSPFELYFRRVPEPLLLLTPEGRIAAPNRSWEELTGFSASEVLGLDCRSPTLNRTNELIGLGESFRLPAELLPGRATLGRTRITSRGGGFVDREVEFWPLPGDDGQLAGVMVVVRPPGSGSPAREADEPSLRLALLELRARMLARHAHDVLVGVGPAHTRILNGVEAAAASLIPVAIIGESGTGKRFVARLIHQQGARRQMPVLWYDCQAIPSSILERELFGTPDPSRPVQEWGRLIAPEGATVVLGDILDAPRDLQHRLFLGLAHPDRAARLIATTAGDLDDAHRDGRLHPDLYQTLTALVIRLRPLRNRLDELPLLAQAMLDRANLRGPKKRFEFRAEAIAALLAYDWPGNLRELARVVEAAHAAGSGEFIEATDLPVQIRGEVGGAYHPPSPRLGRLSLKDQILAHERQLIEQALHQFRFNKTKAARHLGVNRPFLYRRIKELGIPDLDPTPRAANPPASAESGPPSGADQAGDEAYPPG